MTTPYDGGPEGPWPQQPDPWAQPRTAPSTGSWGRRRRGWLLAAVAVVLVAIAGGVTAFVLYNQGKNSDSSKIEALVDEFSDAVGKGNPQNIASIMCAEEAGPFLDYVEDPDDEAADVERPTFEIGDITVRGDAASATLKFEGDNTQTMYFRKENDKWTVCAPARDQM